MISEKLNGVALMHVNQKIIRDTEKVTDIYTGQRSGLLSHKSYFFFHKFRFRRGLYCNNIHISFSFARDVVDSLCKLRVSYVFNDIYVFR